MGHHVSNLPQRGVDDASDQKWRYTCRSGIYVDRPPLRFLDPNKSGEQKRPTGGSITPLLDSIGRQIGRQTV